ncbi:ATP-dependent RNA helicase HrpA [Alteromonas facilis]|uniref:ATP-dependent RNA helicase HrpA n=1 Tax=Alteromonas facilis TaxID=2048004 RepID=UPI001F0CB2B6|nr:ATP-dependent RNA helicase HrpA [Alteromonas facilis]
MSSTDTSIPDNFDETLSIDQVSALLPECALVDAHRLSREYSRLHSSLKKASSADLEKNARWRALSSRLLKSVQRVQLRKQNIPNVHYPDLPVSREKEQIQQAIANNQVIIIAGETGSGKTTQLPKMCLEMGLGTRGMIAHTQPRRLAARSVASRIADELETPIGEHVGFKIRFSDNVSESTYIKLMTDGMLLAEMQNDRFLNQYDTIIIDEAHERSLNIDFLLGYLKQLLDKRPELKLIITSATIDPERFSKHFNDAPMIEVSGRTYPVEIRYHAPEEDSDLMDAIVGAVDELMREAPGDILIFLSGERDIRDAQEALLKQQYRHTEIIPLFARLSASEQNRIFQAHSGRRIVLATNVAETSLTVPGIKYVVDPGLARVSRYSARSKVQRLPIEAISQASANQRAGRCGRTSEGICIRLYSEEDYLGRPEFTDPEILRTNLASVILQMLSLGLGDIGKFPFVQPPDSRNIKDGFLLLEELQAITPSKKGPVLSPLGQQLSRLPIDPRYARMVLAAGAFDAVNEVMIIAAGLSIQDPRERPQDKRQKADEAHKVFHDESSDFIALLNLWNGFKSQQRALSSNQLRKWCKTQFINYLRMREWQDIVSQIKHSLVNIDLRLNSTPAEYDAIHQSIVTGLLSHVGQLDKDRVYTGARNAKFMIFPGSGIANKTPKWVMAAELVETSKLFARVVAKIQPEWIEPLAPHLVKSSYSEPHWSKKRGAVMAFQRVTLLGLPIVAKRSVNYGNIDPVICHELFIREALVNGHTQLNYQFLRDNHALVEHIDELEQKTRRRDLLVSEDELVDFYLTRIPEHIVSEASFKKWYRQQSSENIAALQFSRKDISRSDVADNTDVQFPAFWRQGDMVLPLEYEFDPAAEHDGVSVVIPLPLLNQIKNQGFDWLVPGLRHELVVALIKGLPKRLRRHFVPAPDYATAVLAALTDKQVSPEQPLIPAIAEQLKRMTGTLLTAEDFIDIQLPVHLRMHFRVVNENNKVLARGDNLVELQKSLQGQVQDTLNKAATPEFEREGLTQWDFEQLPEKFSRKTGQFEVQAYPGLVAAKQGVDIKLFDTEQEAHEAHRAGITALVKCVIPSPIKHLQQKLPNKSKLGLYFNPFGSIAALIDDCVGAAIDAMVIDMYGGHSTVRSQSQFDALCEHARANINEDVLALAIQVEKGLVVAAQIQKQLKGKIDFQLVHALADVKAHLSTLVYPGFVSDIGVSRIKDWQRYINGLANRIEKLKVDINRDRVNMLTIEKITQQYSKLLDERQRMRNVSPELLETRWLIEELRVSLFAQQLGTRVPISAKRIENHLKSLA